MPKITHPTYVSQVLELLPENDFIDVLTLMKLTGCNANQVSAALHSLRKYHRADVVVNEDGTGWWFALPESSDTRSRVLRDRAYEAEPRKRRSKKTPE